MKPPGRTAIRFVLILLAVCSAPVASTRAAWGAERDYLKIEGIPGDSKDAAHPGWIEIGGFSFGARGRAAAPDRASGKAPGAARAKRRAKSAKPAATDVTVTKAHDASSEPLEQAAVQAKRLPEVVFELVQVDGAGVAREIYRVKLTDAVVTSFSQEPALGGDRHPFEKLTLKFANIEVRRGPGDAKGNPAAFKVVALDALDTLDASRRPSS